MKAGIIAGVAFWAAVAAWGFWGWLAMVAAVFTAIRWAFRAGAGETPRRCCGVQLWTSTAERRAE